MTAVMAVVAVAYLTVRTVRAVRSARVVLADLLWECANAPAAPVEQRRAA